jgi:four helix bundle protein
MPRDHRRLDVFRLADELAILMYKATSQFPAEERYGLRTQLRRAAVSIPTNLVEGCARETERELLRFVDISFGSAREVAYLTTLAQRLGYLDESNAGKLDELARRIQAALIGLRTAFERQKTPGP